MDRFEVGLDVANIEAFPGKSHYLLGEVGPVLAKLSPVREEVGIL